jgi:hypothetical protein
MMGYVFTRNFSIRSRTGRGFSKGREKHLHMSSEFPVFSQSIPRTLHYIKAASD